ncbi:BamA/TamA family outer membrane protein [Saccharicrinis aurantiacus]|uniref:BamA/TamA family outer membrane protein n=1 Tax=Saccharicrinis aurantiacus TaxID=1849719 RepID=UPI00094F9021|nr:BamA/TamA family outer membrane protein [Saccharicrinis aurantiacus]
MRYILVFLLITASTLTFSQTQTDSIKSKNLKFSILGGPGYTPDYGLLIGGSTLLTFSTNPADSLLKRSVLPFAFAYMANGGGSFMIKPQLFFNQDRFRIFGQISYMNTLNHYYGVGYDDNISIERGTETTEYRDMNIQVNPTFLFRYKDSDLFWGTSFDFTHNKMKDPSEGIVNNTDYISAGGDSLGLTYTNVGIGVNILYDTRDLPANAYSGMLMELNATYYSKAFGSTNEFAVINADYRQFKELKFLGDRRILAWTVNGRFTVGDVPLTELSMVGSPFDLRGYYKGQFRDKHSVYSIAEYRHMFNLGDETKMRKLLSKLGFAAWAGVGTVDLGTEGEIHALPNYGIGLRVEVQPRMNFRLDIGKDPINNQTLLYFNMTESF